MYRLNETEYELLNAIPDSTKSIIQWFDLPNCTRNGIFMKLPVSTPINKILDDCEVTATGYHMTRTVATRDEVCTRYGLVKGEEYSKLNDKLNSLVTENAELRFRLQNYKAINYLVPGEDLEKAKTKIDELEAKLNTANGVSYEFNKQYTDLQTRYSVLENKFKVVNKALNMLCDLLAKSNLRCIYCKYLNKECKTVTCWQAIRGTFIDRSSEEIKNG